MEAEGQKMFDVGLKMLKKGHADDAVESFEKAIELGYKNSACYSWLGVAVAKSTKDMKRAEELCKKAIIKGFFWPQFYLNLAEVYMLWGKRGRAIKTLEDGLKIDAENRPIFEAMLKLGIRKRPPIPFLSRANFLNKLLGISLSRMGVR